MENMFNSYAAARHKSVSKFAIPLIMFVFASHVAVVAGVWAKSQWSIGRLELPRMNIEVVLPPPLPAAGAPPPAGEKPKAPAVRAKIVNEFVQPHKVAEALPTATGTTGTTGTGDGNSSNTSTGSICDPTVGRCDGTDPHSPGGDGESETPPPAAPQIVTPVAAKANFLGGDTQPQPDSLTAIEMSRSGKSAISAVAKICIDDSGRVADARMMKSSGFSGYDATIQKALRGWSYRPFTVNGVPSQVCTTIQFIYRP